MKEVIKITHNVKVPKIELLEACNVRVSNHGPDGRAGGSYLIRRRRSLDVSHFHPSSDEIQRHSSIEAKKWVNWEHKPLLLVCLHRQDTEP